MNKNGAANGILKITRLIFPGALMRTSILGCFKYTDIDAVIENTINICKVSS